MTQGPLGLGICQADPMEYVASFPCEDTAENGSLLDTQSAAGLILDFLVSRAIAIITAYNYYDMVARAAYDKAAGELLHSNK